MIEVRGERWQADSQRAHALPAGLCLLAALEEEELWMNDKTSFLIHVREGLYIGVSCFSVDSNACSLNWVSLMLFCVVR